jgi:hypothetical protein
MEAHGKEPTRDDGPVPEAKGLVSPRFVAAACLSLSPHRPGGSPGPSNVGISREGSYRTVGPTRFAATRDVACLWGCERIHGVRRENPYNWRLL